MIEIEELIKKIEIEIDKSPIGDLKDLLSNINILLQNQTLTMPILKEIFDITSGPWDDPVISEKLYNKMKDAVC